MREDLLALFEYDELQKYFTPMSCPGTRERRADMAYQGHFRVWRGDADKGDLQDFTVEVTGRGSCSTSSTGCRPPRRRTSRCAGTARRASAGPVRPRSTADPAPVHDPDVRFRRGRDRDGDAERTFPVIRDLVTDVSYNYQKARENPVLRTAQRPQARRIRMQQVDVERSQEFRKCIECFLCNNTCHVLRDHEENKESFAGPRFLMRIAELEMHPLDTADRVPAAQAEARLGFCNITKCCTEVCPEGIHITDNALIPMKERVVDRKYDPLTMLFRRKK